MRSGFVSTKNTDIVFCLMLILLLSDTEVLSWVFVFAYTKPEVFSEMLYWGSSIKFIGTTLINSF